jgi:hypothetical protein
MSVTMTTTTLLRLWSNHGHISSQLGQYLPPYYLKLIEQFNIALDPFNFVVIETCGSTFLT